MDDPGVFSIGQVEEQAALITYHHLCTEESADFARLKVRVPSTGERVDSLEAIDVMDMMEM